MAGNIHNNINCYICDNFNDYSFFVADSLLSIVGSEDPYSQKPEITYAEFPFRLEYLIDGQNKIVEDVLICEFDGFSWNERQGKHRQWKERLASGNEEILLLKIDDSHKIYYSPGYAKYYMGDMMEGVTFIHSFPDASYFSKNNDGSTNDRIISADELLIYNIKLISWEPSPTIKNSFK